MKPYRWKRVLGICTAAVLGLSFPAYAVTITPLNPETGQSSSSEPSGTGAPASQENTERLNIAQPVVSSEGAVLMDGASGKVLFPKWRHPLLSGQYYKADDGSLSGRKL